MKANFYRDLRHAVYAELKNNGLDPKASPVAWFKFWVYLVLLLALYFILLFGQFSIAVNLILQTLMAGAIFLFMINNLHDIMHGSYSHRDYFKNWLSYLLDIIGPSSYIWKTKHNLCHHIYTNHHHLDNDLNVSTLLRLSSEQKKLKVNEYQHLYIWPLYAIQCYFWFTLSDLKNYLKGNIKGVKFQNNNFRENFLFFFLKIVHFIVALVIPSLFHGFENALYSYLYIYGLLGFVLAVVFQVAHIFTETKYHNTDKFQERDLWARSQLEGSCAFSVNSLFGEYVYGGLQFQPIHHLFPEINHVHYPLIFKIVEKHCQENNIKLTVFPDLWSAIKSHYEQIYFLGQSKTGVTL